MNIKLFKNQMPPLLPLHQDASARFLPWLMAVIAFFGSVALAATLSLNHLLHRLQADLQHSMTIEIPTLDMLDEHNAPVVSAQSDQMAREAVIRRLQETAGIIGIKPVPTAEIRQLIAPWLDDTNLLASLKLPQLIDVRLNREIAVDGEKLRQRLLDINPGITVQIHHQWLEGLTAQASLARAVAITVMVAAALACLITVGFAARTGLRSHETLIGLLHLLGVRDRDIAWEFQRHILWHSLFGAMMGLSLALAALQGVQYFFHGDTPNQPWIVSLCLHGIDWVLIGLTPLLLAVLALGAAWQIVHRTLDQDDL